jgi:hypothetical protein
MTFFFMDVSLESARWPLYHRLDVLVHILFVPTRSPGCSLAGTNCCMTSHAYYVLRSHKIRRLVSSFSSLSNVTSFGMFHGVPRDPIRRMTDANVCQLGQDLNLVRSLNFFAFSILRHTPTLKN